jgi:hypothetical protein
MVINLKLFDLGKTKITDGSIIIRIKNMQLFPNIGSIILRPWTQTTDPPGPNSPEWKLSTIATIAFFYFGITSTYRLIILSIKSTFYPTLAIAAWRFL